MALPREIVVLGMGGTIAGRAARRGDNVGYVAGEIPVDVLVSECVADMVDPTVHRLVCEQVVQKDSKDMQFDDWMALVQRVRHHLERDTVVGVLITHGTDTLEEGAYFLHLAVPAPLQRAKPIVVTCAMRPSTALAPDGPQNLRDAMATVLDGQPRGVTVVCAGEIPAGLRVRKTHTYRPNAFSSVGGGVLGYVEEAKVRWVDEHGGLASDAGRMGLSVAPDRWPRVEIVTSHAQAGGDLVRAMLAFQGAEGALDGLVVAATGNGTVHSNLASALAEVRDRGVQIRMVSRCPEGTLVGTVGPLSRGRVAGEVLAPWQARIALVLDLALDIQPPVQ